MPAISWNGYELDGSDTSFEVELHDLAQVRKAVAALLQHPLWDVADGVVVGADPDWAPHRQELSKLRMGFADVVPRVLAGDLDDRALVLRVRPPESLEPALLEAIASHSDKRSPHEPEYVLARRPISLGDGEYLDPDVGVVLHANRMQPGSDPSKEPLASQLLAAPPSIELTLGPTFIYEYAMELVESISQTFPNAVVTGGLDCANGWTWGCTYAGTLYSVVALHPDLPADGLVARVFDSQLLQKPRLKGGYNKIHWYEAKHLDAARDINFAAGGNLLLKHLEAPAARGLAPTIEHFINHDDQATREEYMAFLRDVQGSALSPAAKRDVTLAYLCLPQADEHSQNWAKDLLRAQVSVLRPLYVGGQDAGRQSCEEIPCTLHQRICWLGLDPDDTARAVVWVRPTVALYAMGVLGRSTGETSA